MFNPTSLIQDMIDSGLSREEAFKEAKKEVKKRNKINIRNVVYENDMATFFRVNGKRNRK